MKERMPFTMWSLLLVLALMIVVFISVRCGG